MIEALAWKRLAAGTSVRRGACMPKQSEPARTVIRCGDGKVGMAVQIAMTLHNAVSVAAWDDGFMTTLIAG